MSSRFIPDWKEDGTMPPGWTLEYRPEITGDSKWELKHGEGHVRLFKYDGDAVIFARKAELDDMESGSIVGIQSGIPAEVNALLAPHHVRYYAAGEIDWPTETSSGWYFTDETDTVCGPYPSAIVALMDMQLYILFLEGIPSE